MEDFLEEVENVSEPVAESEQSQPDPASSQESVEVKAPVEVIKEEIKTESAYETFIAEYLAKQREVLAKRKLELKNAGAQSLAKFNEEREALIDAAAAKAMDEESSSKVTKQQFQDATPEFWKQVLSIVEENENNKRSYGVVKSLIAGES